MFCFPDLSVILCSSDEFMRLRDPGLILS